MTDALFEEYRQKLNQLNLTTVEDLENLLKPLIQDATKIIVKKPSKMPTDSYLKSNFGGMPYFEKGEKWPKTKNGNNLQFVFQIFNEQGIILPENIKLIQFYDWEESPWDTEGGGWLVKIYEHIDPENAEVIEKPEERIPVKYCEITYETIKSLPDWDGIRSYDVNAAMLSYVLDENEPWRNYRETVEN